MKREQANMWPLIHMLMHMQGLVKGSQVEPDNYGFENMRNRCNKAYWLGHKAATEMLNELGIDRPTFEMKMLARKAFDICQELHGVISDLSPVRQKQINQMIDDIEDGELIYFGNIVANPKPGWLKE